MEDPEEYPIEGAKRLSTTPQGLQRRRARAYDDRTDCRGRCLFWTWCVWSSIFAMEDLIVAILIIGCGVVGEYAALKQGNDFDLAVAKGWIGGIGCYCILWFLREATYNCSDEKTSARAVRDESNRCVQFNFCLIIMMCIVVIIVLGGVAHFCVEGVECSPYMFIRD